MGNKKHVILSEIATASLSPSQAGKVPVYNPTTNDFDLGAGGGGGNLYYQSECPAGYTPDEIPLGSFWYNSITGTLYVRIYHESSDQYLWVTPSLECCGGVSFFYRNTCPDIQPGEILPGSLWYNSETGILAIYIYDADSDQYLWTTPAINCCDSGTGTTGPTGPTGSVGAIESITYSDLYDKVIGSELVPLQWYRLTDYKSVNFLNGIEIATINPTPVDSNFIPQEIHQGDTEVLLLQAISNNEISPIGYSEDFEGEIVEYRPYTNKIGTLSYFYNGQTLPNSVVLSGFDLQWDGVNVFFNMPAGYPVLYGYTLYFYSSFDGGNYRVSQGYSPLTPDPKLVYVEYPDAPDKITNISIENGGLKIVLLDLVEQDFLDYDSDSLSVFAPYALGDAYGQIVRRIDTFKEIDVPFDFRGIKHRRFECEILGFITSVSYTATGSTATDDVYIIDSSEYTTDSVQGQNAEFKITVVSGTVSNVQIFKSGRLYATGETFTIDGTEIGGTTGVDDVVITITNVTSNISYWGQGDVFRGAATTGNYEDFPVFNYTGEDVSNIKWLKTSQFVGYIEDNNVFGDISYVELKGGVLNNTVGGLGNVTINVGFEYNTLGSLYYNTIGSNFYNNVIGSLDNSIIGNEFSNNTIASFSNNIVGNSFNENVVGNDFNNNNIGNEFDNNNISDWFAYNKIGNNFYNNTIGEYFGYGASISQGNVVGNYFYNNTIGEYFYNNTIADEFYGNTIDDYFQLNNVKASVPNTDFTANPATYVYGAYNCDIFRRSDFALRLSYYDNLDVLNIDNIDN
jgi:hypothetical protein